MGWIRRTNFRETNEADTDWAAKQQVARKLATIVLESETVLYGRWFAGDDNIVADSLSRDGLYLPPPSHLLLLQHFMPTQLPTNFHLREVPNEICSFITSMLESLPANKQWWKPPKPSAMLLGTIGSLSSITQVCQTPTSLKTFLVSKGTSLSVHLRKQFAKHPSPEAIEKTWWKEQSAPPSHMWLRPSGKMTGRTPDWTQMAKLASSSTNNAEATATPMAL